ncbi:hypothetical protein KEM54_006400, partial [Ascosphaera aggregata]
MTSGEPEKAKPLRESDEGAQYHSAAATMAYLTTVSEEASRNYCIAEGATYVYKYDSHKSMKAMVQRNQCRVGSPTGTRDHQGMGERDVFVGFYSVPAQVIDELNHFDNKLPVGRFISVDKHYGSVIIMVETQLHAEAARELEKVVLNSLQRMKMARAVTIMGAQGAPQKRPAAPKQKTADVSFRFRDAYWTEGRGKKWPQIVAEVAVTEPEAKLRRDAYYWVLNSEGAVRIALTLNIKPSKITLISWGKDGRALIQGGTLVARKPKGAKNYIIENDIGRLRIPFKDVFAREADPDSGETDFIITDKEMLQIADRVEEVRAIMASLPNTPDDPLISS